MKLALAALLVVAVAIAACGDSESDQERAQNQVCDARADIEQQISELRGLNLVKMKDAQPDLTDQRKQQVESATKAFESRVESVVKGLGTGSSLSEALTDLQNSLIELRDGYQQALAPIDC